MKNLLLPAILALVVGAAGASGFSIVKARASHTAWLAIQDSLVADSVQHARADSAAEHAANHDEHPSPAAADSASADSTAHEDPSTAAAHAAAPEHASDASDASDAAHGDGASGAATTAPTTPAGAPVAGQLPASRTAAAVRDAIERTASEGTEATSLPEKRLARIFAAMPVRDAARVLAQMSDADVRTILGMMGDRQAAALLAAFPPDRAAAITRGRAPKAPTTDSTPASTAPAPATTPPSEPVLNSGALAQRRARTGNRAPTQAVAARAAAHPGADGALTLPPPPSMSSIPLTLPAAVTSAPPTRADDGARQAGARLDSLAVALFGKKAS